MVCDRPKNKTMADLINKLYINNNLSNEELLWLLDNIDEEGRVHLFSLSRKTRDKYYGRNIYLRGLIEFTNYCRRECRYCGINRYNEKVNRYRLTKEELIETCEKGRDLGFNTFVLQGGEDMFFTDERLVDIVTSMKKVAPDCAITLSIGEREFNTYRILKDAGVDRFLLRHETINKELYRWLHPESQLDSRIDCLKNLKSLGYQVGTGFMVGLPWYTNKDYVKDLRFIKDFEPDMVGIGPFIPHEDTSLKDYKAGTVEKTVLMLSLIRLLNPKILLPATTALASVGEDGRCRGLEAGANVIMPNLTPNIHRKDYSIYNNKKSSDSESAEALKMIKYELSLYGYEVDLSIGHSKMRDVYSIKNM